jgi:putative phosphoesterase
MVIGVISDTHGTISAQAMSALEGVDHIIHAGDVGDPDVLRQLRSAAPTNSVRGNMDGSAWSINLPHNDVIELGGMVFYLVHDLYKMDIDPLAAGVDVVISGHTHQPEIKRHKGVLYFNPGSASHGRNASPPSVGRIEITQDRIIPKIITLT